SSGSPASAWADACRGSADEEPPQSAPRRARLEPGRSRRPPRRLPPERQRDRDRQIRSLAPPRLSHRRAVRPRDRGDFRQPVQVNGIGGDTHGTNHAPGLLDGVVADLTAALAAERAGPVRFVGHSMGGLLALKFAKAHPNQVDRLMIVDALPDFAVLLARGGPTPSAAQIEDAAGQMRTATAARYGKPMTAETVAAGVDALAL